MLWVTSFVIARGGLTAKPGFGRVDVGTGLVTDWSHDALWPHRSLEALSEVELIALIAHRGKGLISAG